EDPPEPAATRGLAAPPEACADEQVGERRHLPIAGEPLTDGALALVRVGRAGVAVEEGARLYVPAGAQPQPQPPREEDLVPRRLGGERLDPPGVAVEPQVEPERRPRRHGEAAAQPERAAVAPEWV